MTKIIDSPVELWPGKITLKTSASYADMIAWADANEDADPWRGEALPDQPGYFSIKDVYRYRHALLPGVLQFIEAHSLKDLPSPLTVDNFPAIPLASAAQLFTWLRNEVSKIIAGVNDDEKKGGG